jgi:hypothetical protein
MRYAARSWEYVIEKLDTMQHNLEQSTEDV